MIPYSNEYLLQYKATLNNKGYVEGINEMEGKTTSSTNKMGKSTSALGGKIKGLVNPANLAAAAFAYMSYRTIAAIKDFAAYEKQLSKVNTLLKTSRKELNKYGEGFIDIAIKTGKAKEEIAEGAYQALSAGISNDDLVSFMEKNTKAAIAGYTDVNTAVDGVTTVLNAYGMEVTETDRVLDLFLKTQELGKTTFGEMAQYLADVIPIASSLGIQLEEVTAAIATMTAAGTKTPQAITQVKTALAELAKDGQKANTVFKSINGESFPDFIKNGGTFAGALKKMDKYAKDNNKNMLDLWSSVEAGNAALGLTGGNTKRFTDNLDAMDESAGALDTAYGLATDNIATEWAKLGLTIDNEWKKLVGKLETPIKVIIEVATMLAKAPGSFINTTGDILDKTGISKFISNTLDIMSAPGDAIARVGGDAWDQHRTRSNNKNKKVEGSGDLLNLALDEKRTSKKYGPVISKKPPEKTPEELLKEKNKAIKDEKKRHAIAMQEIDIKSLGDEKSNLLELNSQLETGIITREEYDTKLEDSQKATTEAQKKEYLVALSATQDFYKAQGMMAEANALEKQILEIEVQLNGLEDVEEGLSKLDEFKVQQAEKEEEYNNQKLVREWEFLEELGQQLLQGEITQQEFDTRKESYKENQKTLDEEYKVEELERLRDYYLNVENESVKALEVQTQINDQKNGLSGIKKKQKATEIKWDTWANSKTTDIHKASADAVLATYSALATGQIKSLADFKEFAKGQIVGLLLVKGQEHAAIALSEGVKSYTDFAAAATAAASLNPVQAAAFTVSANAHLSAALQNAAQAAAFGVGAAVVSSSGGGSSDSEDSSSNYNNSPSEFSESVTESSEDDQKKMLYVSVDGSETTKAMLLEIEKELGDGWNTSIIASK